MLRRLLAMPVRRTTDADLRTGIAALIAATAVGPPDNPKKLQDRLHRLALTATPEEANDLYGVAVATMRENEEEECAPALEGVMFAAGLRVWLANGRVDPDQTLSADGAWVWLGEALR